LIFRISPFTTATVSVRPFSSRAAAVGVNGVITPRAFAPSLSSVSIAPNASAAANVLPYVSTVALTAVILIFQNVFPAVNALRSVAPAQERSAERK